MFYTYSKSGVTNKVVNRATRSNIKLIVTVTAVTQPAGNERLSPVHTIDSNVHRQSDFYILGHFTEFVCKRLP